MDDTPDLHAYFSRIGFEGRARADEATLAALVRLHASSIPFENLNPLLGLGVALDIGSLQRKLLHERRGGYCFEHNLLLWSVLRALGFDVSGLGARVLWGRAEDAITPRTHSLLRVQLPDGPRLVDVGFGGLTLTGVLRLEADIEQATPHERFRLLRQADEWRMQALVNGEWASLYRFDLRPQFPVDYELANHYTCTHPKSLFVNHLLCARSGPGQRFSLLDRELTIRHLEGHAQRRTLASPADVCDALEQVFGIALPSREKLEALLARVSIQH
jgi:N-hydroxyarylamine O-acetyltransferase